MVFNKHTTTYPHHGPTPLVPHPPSPTTTRIWNFASAVAHSLVAPPPPVFENAADRLAAPNLHTASGKSKSYRSSDEEAWYVPQDGLAFSCVAIGEEMPVRQRQPRDRSRPSDATNHTQAWSSVDICSRQFSSLFELLRTNWRCFRIGMDFLAPPLSWESFFPAKPSIDDVRRGM
jgi:hypothetical protein